MLGPKLRFQFLTAVIALAVVLAGSGLVSASDALSAIAGATVAATLKGITKEVRA
jgi:hypothetical protein